TPEVVLERGGPHDGFARKLRIRLRAGGHELDVVSAQRNLRGSVALEDDRGAGAGDLREAGRHPVGAAVPGPDVRVRVQAAEQAVTHVAADDPGVDRGLRGRLLEQAKKLVLPESGLGRGRPAVAYWLIRAHSTAPTWPARSPSRARRRRGRR